jgi:hypothetical protein
LVKVEKEKQFYKEVAKIKQQPALIVETEDSSSVFDFAASSY